MLHWGPDELEARGFRVIYRDDGSVHLYQPPGNNNVLGRLRFNFPNKFAVYQHDTSERYLFETDARAVSHGCIRVANPLAYAEVLLSIANPILGYTEQRVQEMYGNAERDIDLTTPIPIHVTYQTASVSEAGDLILRPDIYGLDRSVIAAIRNDDRWRRPFTVVEKMDGVQLRPKP